MSESSYEPIDCSLHDRLEAAATLRRRVLVRYLAADDEEVEEHAEITDIQTSGGAEYLDLSSGSRVRLDRIVSMDGIPYRKEEP